MKFDFDVDIDMANRDEFQASEVIYIHYGQLNRIFRPSGFL